jgi:hypothetical protein
LACWRISAALERSGAAEIRNALPSRGTRRNADSVSGVPDNCRAEKSLQKAPLAQKGQARVGVACGAAGVRAAVRGGCGVVRHGACALVWPPAPRERFRDGEGACGLGAASQVSARSPSGTCTTNSVVADSPAHPPLVNYFEMQIWIGEVLATGGVVVVRAFGFGARQRDASTVRADSSRNRMKRSFCVESS